MELTHAITAIDSHTEGMPTRVVIGGLPPIPGDSISQRRLYAREHLEDLRGLLMREPRGHSAMSGALLQPATRDDADWGVVYLETTGYLPMCGHGTIGVATVLVERGMVEVTEPVTRVRLDTPAGLVVADVALANGAVRHVTIRNVPAFVLGLDRVVDVPGLGEIAYDLAFGGNFYPLVALEPLGLPFDIAASSEIVAAGLRVIEAINAQDPPVHPVDPAIRGLHHVQFTAPGRNGSDGRNIVVNIPNYFDRSPCGTGTSARMAVLHARGDLGLDEDFVHESLIGTRFTGRLVEKTAVGPFDAVVPTITGRAWITGHAEFVLDPSDPFPAGFGV